YITSLQAQISSTNAKIAALQPTTPSGPTSPTSVEVQQNNDFKNAITQVNATTVVATNQYQNNLGLGNVNAAQGRGAALNNSVDDGGPKPQALPPEGGDGNEEDGGGGGGTSLGGGGGASNYNLSKLTPEQIDQIMALSKRIQNGDHSPETEAQLQNLLKSGTDSGADSSATNNSSSTTNSTGSNTTNSNSNSDVKLKLEGTIQVPGRSIFEPANNVDKKTQFSEGMNKTFPGGQPYKWIVDGTSTLVMRGADGKYYMDVPGSGSAAVLTPGSTAITSATSPNNSINTGAYADTDWTRFHGAVQVLGGIGGVFGAGALMLAGAALTPETLGTSMILSGLGWTTLVTSVDQVLAGLTTMITGQETRTVTGTVIQQTTGASAKTSELIAGLTTLTPAAVEGAILLKTTNSISEYNAAIRAGQIPPAGYQLSEVLPDGTRVLIILSSGETGILTASGDFIAQPIVSQLGRLATKADTGIQWGGAIQSQGLPFEKFVSQSLTDAINLNTVKQNFPIFDNFVLSSGEAISVKTLDTTASSYQNVSNITSKLSSYVSDTLNFIKGGNENFMLYDSMINSRTIQLAVPVDTSAAQWVAINQAIDNAASNGVKIVVTVVTK
ncbi:hypothetical protein ACO0LC_28980, partial [Undibacterium sp. JH2W]|uniref:endonuclease toxin domain-containing protein n=1 Tax=Undibacterium sp. JH2W TaxID=3413037 RepID=UPI003BF3B535